MDHALGVQVFGQPELVAHLAQGRQHYSHCISIGNPGKDVSQPDRVIPVIIRKSFKNILRLAFYDVEEKRQLGNIRPKRIPKRADVRKVIRFFRHTENEATGYTIHCWQGISRSPAVALGILYLITLSEREAGKVLLEIRPQALPHQKLVKLFDEELGCNLSAVSNAVRNERIKRRKKGLDLTENSIEELPIENDELKPD